MVLSKKKSVAFDYPLISTLFLRYLHVQKYFGSSSKVRV